MTKEGRDVDQAASSPLPSFFFTSNESDYDHGRPSNTETLRRAEKEGTR